MNKPKWDSPEYGRLWRANNKNKVKINDTKRRIRRQKMKFIITPYSKKRRSSQVFALCVC